MYYSIIKYPPIFSIYSLTWLNVNWLDIFSLPYDNIFYIPSRISTITWESGEWKFKKAQKMSNTPNSINLFIYIYDAYAVAFEKT